MAQGRQPEGGATMLGGTEARRRTAAAVSDEELVELLGHTQRLKMRRLAVDR